MPEQKYAVIIIGCSDDGEGKKITYEPINQIQKSMAWLLQLDLPINYKLKQCGEGKVAFAKKSAFPIINADGIKSRVFRDVINFTTKKEYFDKVFQHWAEFEEIKFIYVHKHGLNDSDTINYPDSITNFVRNYNEYLKEFPEGRHIVCNVAPVFGNGHYDNDLNQNECRPDKINPLFPQIIKANPNVEFLDITGGWDDSMVTDNIHHKTKGNRHLKDIVLPAVLKGKINMEKIIVALVGDSRFNGGTEQSFYKPFEGSVGYFLQQKLGNGYDVRSFSEGGVGVSDSCSKPVFGTQSFQHFRNVQDIKSWWDKYFPDIPYEPDKMIIISGYGVADTKVSEWATNKSRFKPSYQNFMNIVKGNHILCLPQPIMSWADKQWTNESLNECIPLIKSFSGVKICDLNSNYPANLYQTDGIHINESGNKESANILFASIKGGTVPLIELPIGDNMKIKLVDNVLNIVEGYIAGEKYSWNVRYSNGKTEWLAPFGDNFTIPESKRVSGNAFWCYPMSKPSNCSNELTYSDITLLPIIKGCTNPKAKNYNSLATEDDGSCIYDTGDNIIVNKAVLETIKQDAENIIFLVNQELNK